jgi:predicted AAA+ superfamily ATPase
MARTLVVSRDFLPVRWIWSDVQRYLARKTVVLTGARQVGKTTLARQLMERFERAQALIWDGPA